jgi:hypothetical protein
MHGMASESGGDDVPFRRLNVYYSGGHARSRWPGSVSLMSLVIGHLATVCAGGTPKRTPSRPFPEA